MADTINTETSATDPSPADASMTDDTLTDTAFYTPPDLDRHRSRAVLRLRPIALPRLPGAGTAWQVLYVSRDSRDTRIPVSGTVITPEGTHDLTAGPTLLYYPSFHGLGGNCAPSQLLAAGQEPDAEQISAALALGWRVAIPDGEGLGVRGHGPHTWLAGRAAGHVGLDLVRAMRAIPALHGVDTPILVWGYADGGRAAIWAGGLQEGYASELEIRGIAAGAVPTDPGAIARTLDGGPWSGLGLAALIGLSRAYRHLPLRHLLNDEARRLLADAETSSTSVLCERYQHPLALWCYRPDPWLDPLWRYVAAHEAIGASLIPDAPLHLYHGGRDTIVPVEYGHRLHKDFRARGARVSWHEYDANHFRTAREATGDVLARLGENLAARSLLTAGLGTARP